jgi:NAD(P)-dependent dehydrogenase (short-subunit alcohol dehydrogenase family)
MGALVIGGYGGFGFSAAKFLVRDGAEVTILGRKEDRLQAAVDELTRIARFGGRAQSFKGDGTIAADVERAVRFAAEHSTSFKICYATVGGARFAPLLLADEENWRWHFETNVVSAFLAIKYSVPAMARAGGGSIVLTSSRAGKVSWPNLALYGSSKAAVEHLVRTAADELGHLNIRVNAIRPGLTKTPNKSGGSSDAPPPPKGPSELRNRYFEQIPLGRAGTSDDGGAMVRFLAGPESGYVTGQIVSHDGGSELRRAPNVEPMLRQLFGDRKVDAVLAGQIPEPDAPIEGGLEHGSDVAREGAAAPHVETVVDRKGDRNDE